MRFRGRRKRNEGRKWGGFMRACNWWGVRVRRMGDDGGKAEVLSCSPLGGSFLSIGTRFNKDSRVGLIPYVTNLFAFLYLPEGEKNFHITF